MVDQCHRRFSRPPSTATSTAGAGALLDTLLNARLRRAAAACVWEDALWRASAPAHRRCCARIRTSTTIRDHAQMISDHWRVGLGICPKPRSPTGQQHDDDDGEQCNRAFPPLNRWVYPVTPVPWPEGAQVCAPGRSRPCRPSPLLLPTAASLGWSAPCAYPGCGRLLIVAGPGAPSLTSTPRGTASTAARRRLRRVKDANKLVWNRSRSG